MEDLGYRKEDKGSTVRVTGYTTQEQGRWKMNTQQGMQDEGHRGWMEDEEYRAQDGGHREVTDSPTDLTALG